MISSRVTDQEKLKSMAVLFYKSLFSKEGGYVPLNTITTFPSLQADDYPPSCHPLEEFEILQTIKSMQGFKAPGPNGMLAIFCQSQWSTIKQHLTSFITEILMDSKKVGSINATLLSLIPKFARLDLISQYRLIGL